MSQFLAGWKTRIFSALVAVLGIVDMLDPELITTAVGLGPRGHAILLIAIAVCVWVLRQLTTTPPGTPK